MQKELQNPFAYDADQCFDTKVNYLIGWVSLWVKLPMLWSKTQTNTWDMPEGVEGGGEGGLGCVGSLGIDWYITDKYKN